MPGGRPPKPVEQKIREGNPGKRKLPAPLKLVEGGLEKPELPAAASAFWDDIVPILEHAGVLNRVDRVALTALVMQWERAEQARTLLAAQGLFVPGSAGQMVEHPALQVERNAHMLLLRFAGEFGITPVARARIAAASAIVRSTMRESIGEAIGGLDELDKAIDGEAEEEVG